VIALHAGEAVAEIVPERGAICTRLKLGGEELLYLDRATLEDPAKNVRGGIPVLFPIAGKPDAGSPLKQHGFARHLPWDATPCGPDRLECRLQHGGWDLLLAFTLTERALRLDCTVHGDAPFQLGFHPYFAVPDKKAASVETRATQVFDNRTGETRGFTTPDFTQGEQDLHLLDHAEAGTALYRGSLPAIELSWSPDFRRMVLWTLPEKPFICVEPWTLRAALRPPQALSFEIRLSSP
jgi:galactose mutarotase-like enzyme